VSLQQLAGERVQDILAPSLFAGPRPSGLLLFPGVKSKQVGLLLSQESFQKSWVFQTTAQEEFAAAFQHWMEGTEMCIKIGVIMSRNNLE
jgi:hypothetical protein